MYMHLINELSLPAADDGFAGQCQIKEGLAELKGQGVFQCLAIDDQRQLVFLLQRLAEGRAVSCQRVTSSLQEDKHTEGRTEFAIKVSN